MEPRAGVSKQDIREQIWDYMESQNLADFPRPVHHRIPNFKGASRAAEHFPRLQAFKMARTIKVNPDAPQKNARFFVLESKKTLLVPTPRLRTGLFNKITPPPGATKDILRKCATSQGVRNYSTPVGLDSKVLVDLVVVGSVAVSEKGWRIGKGEGYADLEYAMMVSMGAVSQRTPVVTIVHDCQVVDIPEALLEDHDLTVDYILTPTRVITTGCERPKPAGIVWSKISCEMMGKMPILRSLRHREEQAGKDVTLRDRPQGPLGTQAAPSTARSPRDAAPPESGSVPPSSVQIGNLPRDVREPGHTLPSALPHRLQGSTGLAEDASRSSVLTPPALSRNNEWGLLHSCSLYLDPSCPVFQIQQALSRDIAIHRLVTCPQSPSFGSEARSQDVADHRLKQNCLCVSCPIPVGHRCLTT
ncbi:methenyltetrahydrofolate synthase domain-containing protein isoform X2 [Moschus berezovskii]|uniref:methenyltetrahydrofolate synthase domain-containing protein isoform X2 n=1 Tax=Moschus berezovskii TaxID=68408 RepID=UPI0024442E83|nr:methenyltetrahydrofolate synthase domain-containing protein isoform X2 [Moschus berezovskii]